MAIMCLGVGLSAARGLNRGTLLIPMYLLWNMLFRGGGGLWALLVFAPLRAAPVGREQGRAGGVTRAADVAPARRLEAGSASLVVLDDGGLGFRDRPDRWPAAVAGQAPGPWVLVKMSAPVAAGALWEHLLRWHRDRLAVVVTVNSPNVAPNSGMTRKNSAVLRTKP